MKFFIYHFTFVNLLEIYYFEVNLILEAMLHAKLAFVAWFTDILLVL